MNNRLTIKDLDKLKKDNKIKDYRISGEVEEKSKKGKYGNRRTEVSGIWFDSAKEAARYIELRYLLKAGEIKDLELQKEYELNEGGTHGLKYIADFEYTEVRTGERITEDVKGFRTVVYKKKRKLMLKVWGIKVREL